MACESESYPFHVHTRATRVRARCARVLTRVWRGLPSVAGSAGGFLSWYLAGRAFKLPKNQALISGMAAVSP